MPDEFIVVGAGASGLMIAKVLSQAGNQVSVIEARGDIGGRILTIPYRRIFNAC
jgi:monoamine oxidase